MKKVFFLVLGCIASFGLVGCNVSYGGDGGEVVATLTSLPSPQNVRVESDNYVYWDEVPNASSYVVKINTYQESVGNSLKYSISSIMDSRIEANIPTELHITVKAKGNQILFADSEWSNECVFVYTKNDKNNHQSNNQELYKLEIPVFSYDSTNNIISWNSINNSNGYELKINENSVVLPNLIECEYQPKVPANEDFSFSIRALADENSNSFVDSDWSRSITYRYTHNSSAETNMDYVNKSRELGIGYGYNFIDDVYFDVTNSSSNSVLDLEKVYVDASLNAQSSSYTKYDSIYSEKISDFQLGVAAALSSEVSAEGAFSIFSANVSAGLQSSTAVDYSKYNRSGFLNCYSYSEYKNYQMIDYGTSLDLSSLLSKNFLKIISKEGAYSSFADIEIASYILDLFGTHLITGVKTGGRLDYYYSFATNSSSVATDFKLKVTAGGSVGVAGLISASTNNSLSTELSTSLKNKTTESNSSFAIYGGSTEGITASNLEDKMISWSSSINESNARSIGVSKNGIIYLPTLISYVNRDLGKTLDDLIKRKATDAYNSLISKFKTSDLLFDDNTDYVEIYNAEEFLGKIRSNPSGNYVIMNDIDFGGSTLTTVDIFSGILRGYLNNNKIPVLKNFTLSSSDKQYLALFSELEVGGIIRDIGIKSCNVNYSYDNKGAEGGFAALVGLNKGTIDNCEVRNSSFSGYLYKNVATREFVKLHSGAICAVSSGQDARVNKCSSVSNQFTSKCNGGVTDSNVESNVGGIVGFNISSSLVNNCYSSGIQVTITLRGGKTWTFANVDFYGRAAGIAAYNDASVFNSKALKNDKNYYYFYIEEAQSCNYDDHNTKGVIVATNNGTMSGNTEI